MFTAGADVLGCIKIDTGGDGKGGRIDEYKTEKSKAGMPCFFYEAISDSNSAKILKMHFSKQNMR